MERRLFSRFTVFVIVLLSVIFATSTAIAAREPTTPEEIYELGVNQLERGYYVRAVELFERVRMRYPLSQYAALSELRIGDTHFKKGEYMEAVDTYQGFLRAHPRHEEVPYVVYRIALSEFKDAPRIAQRDQTPTWRMLRTINGNRNAGLLPFEERFPGSKYVEDVKTMREEGRLRLAKGLYGIGQFYYRRARFQLRREKRDDACQAAIVRFNQVLDEYPDVEEVGARSLYYAGICELKMRKLEDAEKSVERMRNRFPESKYIARLERKVGKAK